MTCKNCGAELKKGALTCESCGAAVTGAETSVPAKPGKEKKKSYKPAIIAAIAALALLAGGFFGIRALMNRSVGDNSYVYLSNDTLNIVSDPDKGESFEFDKLGSEDENNTPAVQFSPDGEFMYYLSDYNSEAGTGSLKRAEWKKLGKSSMGNAGYITRIDTDVMSNFETTDDGLLLYYKGDSSLHVYNGEKSVKIDENVYDHFLDGSGRIVYTKNSEVDMTVFGADLSAPDKPQILAEKVLKLYSADDFDHIVLTSYGDDGSETLRVLSFEGEDLSVKLGEESTVVTITDNGVYYMNSGDTANLYEFVKDSFAEQDENNRPPLKSDFIDPSALTYHNMTVNDKITEHERVYTSIVHPSRFFEGGFETMEKAAQLDNTDGFVVSDFVERFKSLEDENGYIPLTDEVRDGLVKISETMGTGAPKEWLEMCFYRDYGSDAAFDEEAYNQAQEMYYAATNRIIIRNDLMNEINNVPLYTLMRYDYETKKSEVMVDEILYAKAFFNSLMYKTRDSELETVDINDLTAYWDMYNYMTLDYADRNVLYSFTNDKAYVVEGAAASVLESEDMRADFELLFSGDGLLLNAYGGLYNARISESEIAGFDLLSEDGMVLSIDKDAVYYGSEYNNRGSLSYMNLYKMENGEITSLAKDIMTDTVNVYEDGTILVNTNYTDKGYELTAIDKEGKSRVISEGVESYLRNDDGTVLCISDGEMYLVNGQNSKLIASPVESVWSCDYARLKTSFSGYYDYLYGMTQ